MYKLTVGGQEVSTVSKSKCFLAYFIACRPIQWPRCVIYIVIIIGFIEGLVFIHFVAFFSHEICQH